MIHFDKLFIVFKREYLSRVKSKAYILTTILAPIIFLAIFLLPALITIFSPTTVRTVAVVDESGAIAQRLVGLDSLFYFDKTSEGLETVRDQVAAGQFNGLIFIDEEVVEGNKPAELLYGSSGGVTFVERVRSDVRSATREERLERAEVTDEIRSVLAMRTQISTRVITEAGEEEQDTGALVFLGFFLGFIIYGAMFAYGGIVMRGVIEEKTSRIVEIIVSSVRPFELLLGKVLGVGALALTQVFVWGSAIALISLASGSILMFFGDFGGSSADAVAAAQADLPFTIPTIGADLIITFLVFFLLGYLLYSALFAAVGSALESETENQQLTLLVSLPIIIPIFFLGAISSDPDSTLSTILSLIPFFSPILMPVRAAIMNVPLWELGLSVGLLFFTFLGLMWVSARIYRVGILMYGKSASLKELIKWIRYS